MKFFKPSVSLVLALLALASSAISAQEPKTGMALGGWYVRAGYLSFNEALILNWNERDDLMVNQAKGMPALGVGFAVLPRDLRVGLNVGAQYGRTTLDPFGMTKYTDPGMQGANSPTLLYSSASYSMLLFDLDAYLVPSRNVPVALSLGIVLGGSFQTYTVSGDNEQVQNANGNKSMNMFRYGYKIGVKVMPTKHLSLDLEYRPMAAYTSTTHYTNFLYSKGGWDYFGSAHTTEGPSERMTALALSFHF
jgi:opacity protein-like surface antigen